MTTTAPSGQICLRCQQTIDGTEGQPPAVGLCPHCYDDHAKDAHGIHLKTERGQFVARCKCGQWSFVCEGPYTVQSMLEAVSRAHREHVKTI